MLTIDPNKVATKDLHQYLVGAVAPRPIAFASTVDEDGIPNLAPYSFFNVFSSNPPTLVFSSNRRVSNNTTKDTLHNVRHTGEVVINVVSYDIVRQMTLASIEFPSNVSEFDKSGLTPLHSEMVKPFRVAESPVQFECKVKDIVALGAQKGAGHLIIANVVLLHINEDILDENHRINPHKIDLMGRLGRAFYTRASGESVYTIYQPVTKIGIGFDQLPKSVKNSDVLTGNNLGQLASMTEKPSRASIEEIKNEHRIQQILKSHDPINRLHLYAQKELEKENTELAAKLAWLGEWIEPSANNNQD